MVGGRNSRGVCELLICTQTNTFVVNKGFSTARYRSYRSTIRFGHESAASEL
jgi:hypothetical protein